MFWKKKDNIQIGYQYGEPKKEFNHRLSPETIADINRLVQEAWDKMKVVDDICDANVEKEQ